MLNLRIGLEEAVCFYGGLADQLVPRIQHSVPGTPT